MNPLAKFLAKNKMTPGAFARLANLDKSLISRIAKGERGAGMYMARQIEKATLGAVKVSDWPVHGRRAA